MAFDAIFMTAVIDELSGIITGARVEKVFQPSRDSVLLVLRGERTEAGRGHTLKLLIDAGAANPRICLSDPSFENPKVPPMLCMLLRKHLTGSKILGIKQLGFERAAEIEFETHDEMGFLSRKYIYAEIMGKYSNLIFCSADKKVITATRISDFSGNVLRPILAGVVYSQPLPQESKKSPLDETENEFAAAFEAKGDMPFEKFIMSRYCGISPLAAREIACACDGTEQSAYRAFSQLIENIKSKKFIPVLIKKDDGTPFEYCFMPVKQYGKEYENEVCGSFSKLLDRYFSERSRAERIRARASDILKLLTAAEARIGRKITAQQSDLSACADKEIDKKYGDLITANIYRLSRGMSEAEVTDYFDEECKSIKIPLDPRLTPSQNAQRYYKRYNKSKSAEINLSKQIEISKNELEYIESVHESLTKAETESDLDEIRRELYETGFASKMKQNMSMKTPPSKPMEFMTSGGYRLLCGKNNIQNEMITHKLASKGDLWFHVKGYPGSHVVLFCDGAEPDAKDFTEAAIIAAVYSKAPRGQKVAVDYTRIKNVKKPPASKPGYVTFSENYSAYVVPDQSVADALRQK